MAITASLNHRRSTAVAVFFTSLLVLFLGPGRSDGGVSSGVWAYPGDRDIITAEFWTELDPIMEGLQPNSPAADTRDSPVEPLISTGVISQEEAIRRTLEEARIVLSGMIYGFDVLYTPQDRERKVEEELVIEARAEIPHGDPSLRVLQVRTSNNKYFVHVRYNLADFQQRRLQSWGSNTLTVAAGRGTEPLQGGYRAKFESFNQAIKNALREHLRPRYKNKPRRIKASVALTEPPYTVIDAGGYHSRVRLKIDIREVQPYSAY